MTIAALCIAPDAVVYEHGLPADYAGQLRALRGSVDAAVYHRRAHFHVHGAGVVDRLPFNVAAWAVACAWRGLEVPYGLYGAAVVTGADRGGGGWDGLDGALAAQVQSVCAAIRGILAEWWARPPAGEDAARAEVLAVAHQYVAPTHQGSRPSLSREVSCSGHESQRRR